MKVEERIARAYHRDLSWRKVLVKLEPDAHNNMIVRRMFANAYGWPVGKHLCDTHFSDSWAARNNDDDENNIDRARTASESDLLNHEGKSGADSHIDGEEVEGQTAQSPPQRVRDAEPEMRDGLGNLDQSSAEIAAIEARHKQDVEAEASWDSHFFSGSDSDEDDDDDDDDDGDETPKHKRRSTTHVLHPNKPSQAGPRTPAIILDEPDHLSTEPEPLDGSAAVPVSELQSAVDEALHEAVGTGPSQ